VVKENSKFRTRWADIEHKKNVCVLKLGRVDMVGNGKATKEGRVGDRVMRLDNAVRAGM
jgi:hypothetical protein